MEFFKTFLPFYRTGPFRRPFSRRFGRCLYHEPGRGSLPLCFFVARHRAGPPDDGAGRSLGQWGRGLRFLLVGVFLALGLGWQYDVFFHRLPKYNDTNSNFSGHLYVFGTITAKHLEGWDTYVDLWDGTNMHPENNYFYSRSDMEKGRRIIFRPDQSPLPLKSIPEKGALLLLSDQMGQAYRDWIRYYYPDAPEKEVLNPFGDVEYRLWEINPDQIEKALKRPGPSGGMMFSCFDLQGRKLAQWRIPTLSAQILDEEWFAPCTGKPPFPLEKTAYFIARGGLENPVGKVLALDANGKIDGFIGSRKIRFDGLGSLKRLEIPIDSGKGRPFELRYSLPKEGGFYFSLLEHTPLGWTMIHSSELSP